MLQEIFNRATIGLQSNLRPWLARCDANEINFYENELIYSSKR